MIPTIEQIVADLLAGTLDAARAIVWLNEHKRLAVQEERMYPSAGAK